MAIEEKEAQETLLKELIEKVEKDPIPTHIFTTEDTDPLVLLGKLNEIIAKLKDLRALYISSDVKATQALDNAINALANATQALQSANTALSTANTAIDISNDAVDTATTLGNQANNKADDAVNQANEALRVAQEALTQIVEGLGSKVYDISDNLLASVKFNGDNGINVDMSEDDPETFDIRLDDTITKAIEDNNTLAQNNKASIDSITEDITGIKQAQASDSLAIVDLQSKNLTQDEEIAGLQNYVGEIFNLIYPIGSIYMSVNSTNPTALFGGTWVAWGAGRVTVGVGNNGEMNFDTPEITGGSANSVASHRHYVSGTTEYDGTHEHTIYGNSRENSGTQCVKFGQRGTTECMQKLNYGETIHNVDGAHSHTINLDTQDTGILNGNMQPYITCYMWKRTA